jgi:hypothetical protein
VHEEVQADNVGDSHDSAPQRLAPASRIGVSRGNHWIQLSDQIGLNNGGRSQRGALQKHARAPSPGRRQQGSCSQHAMGMPFTGQVCPQWLHHGRSSEATGGWKPFHAELS